MKKSKVLAAATLTTVAVFVGGCGSTSQTDKPAAPYKPAPSPFVKVLDDDYNHSVALCTGYFSLVNQGWTDDDIYSQLDHAGTFDDFYGQGESFFHTLIKWCYKNT